MPKEKKGLGLGLDALFGAGSCYVLRIRPVGGIKIV